MTADTITAIKKALEELREKIGHAYDSGYNRLGQLSDWCADLDAMRPTLESLQRENEELRQDLKDATEIIEAQNQDHASNNIRFAENAHRAEAAEAEVKRLREDNERLAKEAGYIGATLSSTGDTHGN
ncbi:MULTISPECIES: hypothetical protein [unclassified Rhizobium]|uniref:hypothetical protein n=1 Tax=unclassified Rhizobium TaxID=2613769 RepID=UPI00288B7C27|nr:MULTISPECIES: hypothetical protein [unclassified Rhizobium]